jgi:hypothetical protein
MLRRNADLGAVTGNLHQTGLGVADGYPCRRSNNDKDTYLVFSYRDSVVWVMKVVRK